MASSHLMYLYKEETIAEPDGLHAFNSFARKPENDAALIGERT